MTEVLAKLILLSSLLGQSLSFSPPSFHGIATKLVHGTSTSLSPKLKSLENYAMPRQSRLYSTRSNSQKTRQKGGASSASLIEPIFHSEFSVPEILPKLLVFDLDNTLWTPELYQIRQKNLPKPEKDIFLFQDAKSILHDLANNPAYTESQTQLAIASRTHKGRWAEALLSQFVIETTSEHTPSSQLSLDELIPHKQIITGSKKIHFQKLQESTGIPYREMVFFDDDARMNLEEISQLGVLCCHCPRGITSNLFRGALMKYNHLKKNGPERVWMGYTVTVHDLHELGVGNGEAEMDSIQSEESVGRVKFYSDVKRFGFIQKDGYSGKGVEEYFFHESKLAYGLQVSAGMRVKFEAGIDSRGRPAALSVDALEGVKVNGNAKHVKGEDIAGETTNSAGMVEMPCFSMSQPFTALLLNGIKTTESRNTPIFDQIKPGTMVLVHCGKRDWKDTEAPQIQLQKMGYSNDEIDKLSALPEGFKKGSIVGVVEFGRTWETTQGERRRESMQNNVVASSENIGKWCTKVSKAQWLKRPLPISSGKPGIYNAKIPGDFISSV